MMMKVVSQDLELRRGDGAILLILLQSKNTKMMIPRHQVIFNMLQSDPTEVKEFAKIKYRLSSVAFAPMTTENCCSFQLTTVGRNTCLRAGLAKKSSQKFLRFVEHVSQSVRPALFIASHARDMP
mmetsp:Transcript_60201/g.116087  ORF Transcript_60201/g.116087 Transcript_60201/m.116087 type:complete len:125 (+) Transcript_60201:205-579(+)